MTDTDGYDIPCIDISHQKRSIDSINAYMGTVLNNFEPTQVYTDLNRPLPSRMPGSVSNYLARQMADDYEYDGQYFRILRAAVDNTQEIVHMALRDHYVDKEQSFAIVEDPRTIHTLATVAMRSVRRFDDDSILPFINKAGITISKDEAFITKNQSFGPEQGGGCPFAGHDNTVEYHPLFERVGTWAGQLAVESYFEHLANK